MCGLTTLPMITEYLAAKKRAGAFGSVDQTDRCRAQDFFSDSWRAKAKSSVIRPKR